MCVTDILYEVAVRRTDGGFLKLNIYFRTSTDKLEKIKKRLIFSNLLVIINKHKQKFGKTKGEKHGNIRRIK